MLDHVTIRVSDRAASERFYLAVLPTLGIDQTWSDDRYAEWDAFSLARASGEKPVTKRLHIGFAAPSREQVDEFWRVGTAAGYRDDGAPGPRPQYSEDYYGAFLLDPDGNSVEAVHHRTTPGRLVDHLWIGVRDVAAAARFYDTIAPYAGIRRVSELTGRVHFAGESGSFGLVARTPTQNLHMAFSAADDATVDAFHEAAVAAGYRDNGPPGERRVYHPGYYGAYVLDPDGNNVEVVNHNR